MLDQSPSQRRYHRRSFAVAIAAIVAFSPASHADELEQTLKADGLTVEHRLDTKINGIGYTLIKAANGKKIRNLIVSDQGEELRREEYLQRYAGQFEKLGKLHPDLYELFSKNPDSKHEVVALLDLGDLPSEERPEFMDENKAPAYEKKMAELVAKRKAEIESKKAALMKESALAEFWNPKAFQGLPMVVLSLNFQDIEVRAAKNDHITALFARDNSYVEDLAQQKVIASADTVHNSGITALNQRIGVFECEPDSLGLIDIFQVNPSPVSGCNSSHARMVAGIIDNVEVEQGFAPSSQVYSAGGYDLDDLDWLVNDAVTRTVNQSFHRNAEISSTFSFDDLYKDYLAVHYPYPTIIHAAGNWCASGSCYESGAPDIDSEYVNHKGFNTISVGNHNDDASAMSASSVYRNPGSPTGDRELPEIAANGTGVTVAGGSSGGTSFSAPAVAGSVGLLQETDATLRYWPEGNRALLFAGARRNITQHPGLTTVNATNTWWADVNAGNDGFDGAGALNIQRSVNIAKNRWNGNPVYRGWDVGYLDNNSFFGNFYTTEYEVSVPQTWAWPVSVPVKIALAWSTDATRSSASGTPVYASTLAMDLDLRVYDSAGAQVAYSLSWDNSYEIVDFHGEPGETYTIKIHRAAGGVNDRTWFGIAWDTRPIVFHWPGILETPPFELVEPTPLPDLPTAD